MNDNSLSEVRNDIAALREVILREIGDVKTMLYNLQPRAGGAATDLAASVAQINAPASGHVATDLSASVAQIQAPAKGRVATDLGASVAQIAAPAKNRAK